MMTDKENTRISKFLSLVLRHRPETIGIELDENGWTDVKMLIDRMNQKDFSITVDILQLIVATNPKKRFALNERGDMIRANQGHSIEVDLGYIVQHPPAILYHGTGEKSVSRIQKEGLVKMDRHHVHLSADIETAMKVGQRHGKPFVFQVLAEKMFLENFAFYLSDNGVWLTDSVPVDFLVPLGK